MNQTEKPYVCTALIDRGTAKAWKLLTIEQGTTSKALMYEGYGLLLARHGFDLPNFTAQSIQGFSRPMPDAKGVPSWELLKGWHTVSDEMLASFRGHAKRVASTFGFTFKNSVFVDPVTVNALLEVSGKQNATRESLHYEAMSIIFRRYGKNVPLLVTSMLREFHRPTPDQGIVREHIAPVS